MKKCIVTCLMSIISMAAALTPEGGEQLYAAPTKDGEVCLLRLNADVTQQMGDGRSLADLTSKSDEEMKTAAM